MFICCPKLFVLHNVSKYVLSWVLFEVLGRLPKSNLSLKEYKINLHKEQLELPASYFKEKSKD